MLDFGNSAYPKASKVYKCDLCGELIQKGEIYHRWSGKYDGDMFDYKYHKTCQDVIDAYCNAMGEQEYTNDAIYDWLYDQYCLDCMHHKNGDCTEKVLSCPLIMEIRNKDKNK